jgi:hypothetical protein
MFSVFMTVLGLIQFYDQSHCAGIKINFDQHGLYFDPNRGDNWWAYYFQPIESAKLVCSWTQVSKKLKRKFTKAGLQKISRDEAHRLIQQYIRVRPEIQEKVDRFVESQFGKANVIGVHYRGTDKRSEAPRVPYHRVLQQIEQVARSFPQDDYLLFVATDERSLLSAVQERYPGKVICTDAMRSDNFHPVHKTYKNSYNTGEEALIDCLLLSKCGLLIRTASNLSTCAGYFNPRLPILDLNFLYVERSRSE